MNRREWLRRSALLGTAGVAGCRQETPNKQGLMTPGQIHPSVEDYITARKGFRTKLIRVGPSPEKAEMPPQLGVSGALPMTYTSGGQPLLAWVNPELKVAGPRRPTVLFLRHGFAFSPSHWEYARPFLRAGFHVVIPVLRGENGQPGAFSLLYDEVDDCVACADMVSRLSSVDPRRIFVCGHGTGGTLALLCALAWEPFRGCSALSAAPSMEAYLRGREREAPFDPTAEGELRMRSPLYYSHHFHCPVRSFFGQEEGSEAETNWSITEEMNRHGRGAGKTRDLGEIKVPGDRLAMIAPATKNTISFFRSVSGLTADVPS